jgi:hypothetical protein
MRSRQVEGQTDRIEFRRNGTALIPPLMQKLNFFKITVLSIFVG